MPEPIRFSIGGIPLPNTRHISLGERHPSQAGAIGLEVETQGDLISAARVQPGFLHRAAEKLFEVRDYRSAIMLADRHDWLSSFSGELLVTQSIERAMGLKPPQRVMWLRILLSEFARIHSHLSYLSYVDSRVWPVIEQFRAGLISWSGNRIHPMLNRVGGLAADVPEGWLTAQKTLMTDTLQLAETIQDQLADQFTGLAVADQRLCREYALTGPVSRACGLQLDPRQLDPDYSDVLVIAPVQLTGDAHARFTVLLDEVRASARMILALADEVPAGPVSVKLSRRLKVPEGLHISELAAPWGIASALLVSRGGQTPWRLALRTPTFANVSALERLLVGASLEQIPDVVASVGFAIGDLDK